MWFYTSNFSQIEKIIYLRVQVIIQVYKKYKILPYPKTYFYNTLKYALNYNNKYTYQGEINHILLI